MAEAIFTFPVDKALKEQFTAAAESGDRPAEQVLRDFMREFVRRQREAIDDDAWFRHQVQVGIDAANAGDVASFEEVEAEAAAWREEMRRKLASSGS